MRNFFLLAILALICQSSFAAEIEEAGPLRKLQRGFVNVALSPIEISTELSKEKSQNSDQFPPSWATGVWRGSAFMVGRALSGIYDIVTFPLPLPSGYEGLVKPEFVWDHFKTSPTIQNK